MKRTLGLALVAATATSLVATAAVAAPTTTKSHDATAMQGQGLAKGKGKAQGPTVDLQILHTSDFHGHLEPSGGFGGAAYLAGLMDTLRTANSVTLASGDIIGGSTFESGLFQDEPTIEVMNALGLDHSSVGNHEFDEGFSELQRIIEGGNHPELGQFGDEPYAGTDFSYLGANVVYKDSGEAALPPYVVENVRGVRVGVIGIVTSDTPILVSPGGIADLAFLDEAETINRYAEELADQGVKVITVAMHEGGYDAGLYPKPVDPTDVNVGCDTLSGPILDINAGVTAEVDVLMTGHTHNAYVCQLPDPEGVNRLVTSAGDWGRVLTELNLTVDRRTGDVVREASGATNHVVVADETAAVNAEVADIVDYWVAQAAVVAGDVVGSVTEDILGDSSGDRGIETPMADLVADSILWGTQDAGAQISFMNVGGVRDSFYYDEISASEQPGEITYSEAYDVAPFGNLLVTLDLTGADIEAILNQQYNEGRSRKVLALGVSEGFTYSWDSTTNSVVPGSMMLDGVAIDPAATYKVSTLNFLAEGGDGFTAFGNATATVGGPEDLANLVNYLRAHSPVSPPADRVTGL